MTENHTSDQAAPLAQTSVFFSYSRADRARALPIIRLIEAAGFATWWDGLLEGGERYSQATAEALDRARAVVVLWSVNSVASHWVHDEATRGRDRGLLVPIALDGTEPPLGFGQFQVIDLSRAKMTADDPQIVKLLRAVSALHNQPLREAAPHPIGARINRRTAIGGGIAAVAAIGGLFAWKSGLIGGGPDANSVAVLPFANLSGDPAQQYFSDGLAAEIRAQLSRNALLEIAGQTSSNLFREGGADDRAIARKLGVAFLLNGTVQKVGDQLKVTTALIDGRDGKNAWSTVFERRLADVFAVQSEIAGAVARELSVTIDERQDGKKEKQVGGTDSLAAFDAYLRGRDLFDAHVDEASDRAALAKFEQAIALDENYAAARAARSRSLAVIANQYASAGQRRMLYDEAIAEADRATKLAPDYAYGFIALGYAIFYGRLQAREARPSYEQAIKLGGGDVDVLSRYALYCARTGRFAEADSTIARAAALDPLNASMFKSAGNIKYAARSYSEAIDHARKALEISPKRATLRGDMGNAFLMMGNLDAAEAEFKLETNNLLALPGLAIVAHRRGNAKAADAAFAALIGEYGDIGLYQQAQVLAQRAQTEAAFTTLDKARADSDSGLVYLLNDPLLDPIRSDQRFNILLHRFGFA